MAFAAIIYLIGRFAPVDGKPGKDFRPLDVLGLLMPPAAMGTLICWQYTAAFSSAFLLCSPRHSPARRIDGAIRSAAWLGFAADNTKATN